MTIIHAIVKKEIAIMVMYILARTRYVHTWIISISIIKEKSILQTIRSNHLLLVYFYGYGE